MFDAAPQLATLHLDSVFFRHDGPRARLRCPAVTALVMADCGWELENGNENTGVELDAPALRRFRYKGLVRRFSLVSPAPDLMWVDLHLGARDDRYQQLFWQFVYNFSNTKALNLRMEFYLEDIAITGDKISYVELLGNNKKLFSNLEHLELGAPCKRGCEATGVAIANFLHCSPAIRVLRLNLSTVGGGHQSEFKTMMNSSNDDVNEVSGIPGLSGHSFNCLQSSLRSLSLQFRHSSLEFRMEKANCFEVRLAKFFAENCIVLEEMKIDNGNQKLHEHINHKVGTWVANSSKRRNWPSTTVAVVPLER
ncbi:uncharacterized protein LOC104584466 isoform X2 [Brachypodium distachyon]|uniref:uncharacterized protein LOC104584466 isoform X2 n=1 Tax=Brachypodium distachyon TaxID=15368 RepID=UPI00071DE869|nr:uncharacterized protein LOC104584466 isoform X2 [Brachypodium distachyon]|eukprot:XP_014757470.1 uncharacterized protein LOC104584466 isoform X2 [Brachypodium distachyon]